MVDFYPYMCQGQSTPYIGDGHPTCNRKSLYMGVVENAFDFLVG